MITTPILISADFRCNIPNTKLHGYECRLKDGHLTVYSVRMLFPAWSSMVAGPQITAGLFDNGSNKIMLIFFITLLTHTTLFI